MSAEGYACQLEDIRETLVEAGAATERNKTKKARLLGRHITTLVDWAALGS